MSLTKVTYSMIAGSPVNLLDFGASPSATGATNSTALQDAMDAVATTGQTIYIPAGTYAFSSVVSTTGHLNIVGDGNSTVLDFTGVTSTSDAITVTGSLTQIQGITTANKNGLTVTFASTPSLTEGDVFVIFDPTNSSFSGWRTYYKAGEWLQAIGISGNAVKVDNPIYQSYTPANVNVYKLASPNVSFRNFKIIGNNVLGLLKTSLCNSPVFENITAYNENYQCIYWDRCYKPTAINLDLFNIGTSSDDYGLTIGNSQRGKVIGGNYFARRHGITMGGGNDTACVPCRDINVSGATISNNIDSGVYSADFHGNVQDCYYENCTIYGGGAMAGIDNGYKNCIITAMYGGMITYAGEIIGGTHVLNNCELYSDGLPSSGSRGYIDIGGNSSPVTANTTSETTFVVKNCRFSLPATATGESLVKFTNNGAVVNINFDIDGIDCVSGGAGLGAILRTSSDSGTPYSNYIIVNNISRFADGCYLHTSVSSAYSNFPHRCQSQTGNSPLTATTGTNITVGSAVNFRYKYPRAVYSTTTLLSVGPFNSVIPVIAGTYSTSESYIRAMLYSGTGGNWTATTNYDVNWTVGINDI